MALLLPAFIYDAGAGDVTINFTQPIEKDDHEDLRLKKKDVFGGTGIRQRNTLWVEERIVLSMQFETEATIDLVTTMMRDWVLLGNTFKYVPDNTDLLTFTTVESMDSAFRPVRIVEGSDLWKFKMNVRKAIT